MQGESDRRTCILVLGMHRSGTSAITRVLSLLGAGLPKTLLEPAHGNELGHWEPRLIQELNDQLLHEIGSRWDDWRTIDCDSLPTHRRYHFKSAISQIIEDDFPENRVIVVKDPRICRLTDIYFDVLKALDFDIRVIIPVRNPNSVSASLEKRDGTSQLTAQLYWIRHVLDAEASSRTFQRVFVEFDDLTANWRAELEKVIRELALPFDLDDTSVHDQVNKFLDPKLNNFQKKNLSRNVRADVTSWTNDIYGALLELSSESNSDSAVAKLDSINSEFTRTATLFSDHVSKLMLASQTKDAQLLEVQLELEKLGNKSPEAANQVIEDQKLEIEALNASLTERDVLLSTQSATIQKQSATIQKQSEEHSQTKSALDLAEQKRLELDVQVSDLSVQNADLLTKLNDEKESAREIEIKTRANSSALEAQTEALKHSIEELTQQLVKSEEQLKRTIEDYETSTSWRISRPLRMIRRLPQLVRERKDVARLRKTELFDAAWYSSNYSDVEQSGLDPALHFIRHGGLELRSASAEFDCQSYVRRYPDVQLNGGNPLLHFLQHGASEGRVISDHAIDLFECNAESPANSHVSKSSDDELLKDAAFIALSSDPYKPVVPAPEVLNDDCKLIAFYLPQFHPIAENSEWWAPGFTEWTNVSRGRPNFVDHYQPHIPRELGHYDLGDPNVLREQARMARLYGVDGFCFYHYWFSGRRILEKPVAQFLQSDIDIGFCLCWANENWTRTWDGDEKSVLLSQDYTEDDAIAFIEDILPALKDKRYIRVGGKPLLVVYRAKHIPDASKWFQVWRDFAVDNGLPGLHVSVVDFYDITTPDEVHADSLIEFPPHKFNGVGSNPDVSPEITNKHFSGGLVDYHKIIAQSAGRPKPDYQLFRGIIPSWDNTARRQHTPTIVVNASPTLYGSWLRFLRRYTQFANSDTDNRLIFINAWNEWGEGCHLEPDMKWGLDYLEETLSSKFEVADNHVANLSEAELILRDDFVRYLNGRARTNEMNDGTLLAVSADEMVTKLFRGPSSETRLIAQTSQLLQRCKPVHTTVRRAYRTLNHRT